jgi:hypothetical protein
MVDGSTILVELMQSAYGPAAPCKYKFRHKAKDNKANYNGSVSRKNPIGTQQDL